MTALSQSWSKAFKHSKNIQTQICKKIFFRLNMVKIFNIYVFICLKTKVVGQILSMRRKIQGVKVKVSALPPPSPISMYKDYLCLRIEKVESNLFSRSF